MIKVSKKLKNILISIFFLMLLFLVLTNKYYPFNNDKLVFSENIYVENNTDYDVEYKTKIILNKIFCYDSIYIKYVYMAEEMYIGKKQLGAYVYKNFFFDNQYIIFISKDIRSYNIDVIISHELEHVNQMEKGDLLVINPFFGIFAYKGDTIDSRIIPYQFRQFEIDAYELEENIYDELQSYL